MEQKTYHEGYYDGVVETLDRVSKFIDDDTLDELREQLLK